MFTIGFNKTASIYGATYAARRAAVATSAATRTAAPKASGFVSKVKGALKGAPAAPSAAETISKMPTAQAGRAERGLMKSKGQAPEKVKQGKKVQYSGAVAKPKEKAAPVAPAAKPVDKKPAGKSFLEQHGGKAALIGGGALAGHMLTRNDSPER